MNPEQVSESSEPFSDIAFNRKMKNWTRGELLGRVLWTLVQPLFRWSPRICWGWRVWMLRLFGAKIGKHVRIDPSARIFIPWNLTIGTWVSVGFDAVLYNLGQLTLGDRATVSQRAHLCGGSHDFRDPAMSLIKCPITIDQDAWVCADAFVGPGVCVGAQAVVGASACVVRDVPAGTIVAGNPAQPVGTRLKV